MTQVSTTSDLVQTAQTLSNATTALVRHTQTRVAEMTHVELKERLQKAVDGVRRNSPLLISATRTVISVDGQVRGGFFLFLSFSLCFFFGCFQSDSLVSLTPYHTPPRHLFMRRLGGGGAVSEHHCLGPGGRHSGDRHGGPDGSADRPIRLQQRCTGGNTGAVCAATRGGEGRCDDERWTHAHANAHHWSHRSLGYPHIPTHLTHTPPPPAHHSLPANANAKI